MKRYRQVHDSKPFRPHCVVKNKYFERVSNYTRLPKQDHVISQTQLHILRKTLWKFFIQWKREYYWIFTNIYVYKEHTIRKSNQWQIHYQNQYFILCDNSKYQWQREFTAITPSINLTVNSVLGWLVQEAVNIAELQNHDSQVQSFVTRIRYKKKVTLNWKYQEINNTFRIIIYKNVIRFISPI
jgi:hypothetical protein